MPILELDDLSLRFGGVTALSDFSMEVRKGELLALIGPNGARQNQRHQLRFGTVPPAGGDDHPDRR